MDLGGTGLRYRAVRGVNLVLPCQLARQLSGTMPKHVASSVLRVVDRGVKQKSHEPASTGGGFCSSAAVGDSDCYLT